MISNKLWIVLLIAQCVTVTPRPARREEEDSLIRFKYNAQNKPKYEQNDEQVISVRITSSVAVGRSRVSNSYKSDNSNGQLVTTPPSNKKTVAENTQITKDNLESIPTEIPRNLAGANIEFIKQLNAKKETKKQYNSDQVHPFQLSVQNQFLGETDHLFDRSKNAPIENTDFNNNENFRQNFPLPFQQNNQSDDSLSESALKSYGMDVKNKQQQNIPLIDHISPMHSITHIPPVHIFSQTENNEDFNATLDSIAEPSIKSVLTIPNTNYEEDDENIENVPLARSVPLSSSSQNYIQGLTSKSVGERGNSLSLTTVSFNILHETPNKLNDNYNNDHSSTFTNSNDDFGGSQNNFFEPSKIYSQPAKIYSEPAKFYSEPAKIYSEPAKIYSEPAKIYSEPAKIYSQPAKFYSQPASLHLTPENLSKYSAWQSSVQSTPFTNTPWNPSQNPGIPSTINTTPTTTNTITKQIEEHMPEKNYEVDEKISVISDGRSHGIQETTTEKCKQDNCKVGYVVEGRQYKKYRVEERTPDGFIVGEYGVVRNEDGALRGVRYTADSDASPRLIYDALMKFLQLK